jgi:hypothetical protein
LSGKSDKTGHFNPAGQNQEVISFSFLSTSIDNEKTGWELGLHFNLSRVG